MSGSERQKTAADLENLSLRYGAEARYLARRLAGEKAAEDAVQQALLGLARAGKTVDFNSPGRVRAYFLKAVAREALRLSRDGGWPGARSLSLEEVPEPPAPDGLPARLAERREALLLLDEELARLPPEYRQPLVLTTQAGLTQQEAAAALGLPQSAVSVRAARARDLLRARLSRRGLALSGATLAALVAAGGPAEAAAALAGGTMSASAGAAAANTVGLFAIGGMAVTKTMLAAAAAAVFAVAAGMLGLGLTRGQDGEQAQAPAATAPAATASPFPTTWVRPPAVIVEGRVDRTCIGNGGWWAEGGGWAGGSVSIIDITVTRVAHGLPPPGSTLRAQYFPYSAVQGWIGQTGTFELSPLGGPGSGAYMLLAFHPGATAGGLRSAPAAGIAWGEAREGLQAGLSVVYVRVTARANFTLPFITLHVRNVGENSRSFNYHVYPRKIVFRARDSGAEYRAWRNPEVPPRQVAIEVLPGREWTNLIDPQNLEPPGGGELVYPPPGRYAVTAEIGDLLDGAGEVEALVGGPLEVELAALPAASSAPSPAAQVPPAATPAATGATGPTASPAAAADGPVSWGVVALGESGVLDNDRELEKLAELTRSVPAAASSELARKALAEEISRRDTVGELAAGGVVSRRLPVVCFPPHTGGGASGRHAA